MSRFAAPIRSGQRAFVSRDSGMARDPGMGYRSASAWVLDELKKPQR